MPSGIEGHRVEASENWWTMEMIMFELKWNKTIVNSNTIDELMKDCVGALRNIIWEKTSLENSRKLMQNMRLSPSGTPSVQLTFAAPAQFDYAGNQPTNQGQSWFLRKIFIVSLLRVAFHQTTADFRQLPFCWPFLQIQLKHMETPFHVPGDKTRQKNNFCWTKGSNN